MTQVNEMTDLTDTHIADTSEPLVHNHPHYGPALPALQWVPAPRYLMRRDVILRIARNLTPGRFLEVGCGAGALLDDLTRLGFTAVGADQSPSALKIARALLADNPSAEARASCEGLEPESFDQLAAFEVLEHIEDDLEALSDWARYLKSGGALMVSVPAHPHRWNPADVWAGHYRRYTRSDLETLVRKAGFDVEQMHCYGFPVANIMERLSARIYARQTNERGGDDMGQYDRTNASGTDRSLLTRLWPFYSAWPATMLMRLIWRVQRMFLNGDRGIGYLVVARKT